MKYFKLIIISLLGSIVGVKLAMLFNPNILKNIMIIILIIMFGIWLNPGLINNSKIKSSCSVSKIISTILFFFGGLYNAMIGAGGGIIFSIFYLIFTNLGLKEISSYRLITNGCIALFSGVLFFIEGKIDFGIVISGFLAGLLAGQIGAHLLRITNEKILKITSGRLKLQFQSHLSRIII